jgi:Dyp-type peroxidase family
MELPLHALRDIQGIIVTGYGHQDHRALLFLQIRDAVGARRWLGQVIPYVATAAPWPLSSEGKPEKPLTALNIGITHPGFKAIGMSEDSLFSFSREFILGMPERAPVLGDTGTSAPDTWEVGGPNNPEFHVLVTISGVTRQGVDDAVEEQRRLIDQSGGAVVEVLAEGGSRPPITQKEPFGFRDGISNPGIEGTLGHNMPSDWVVRTGQFILGYLNELNVFPSSPGVLADQDPHGILPRYPQGVAPECRDFGRNGSYLAYRKLEQDVAGFWCFAAQQAVRPDGTVDHHEAIKTAAKFVGRWPGGAPLTLSPDEDCRALNMADDFRYEDTDHYGFKCPVGAHIRRSNPRDSLFGNSAADTFRTTKQHRILRRAVSYGADYLFDPDILELGRLPETIADDGQRRGIHFMCVNADFSQQFEMVSQSWANYAHFNGLYNNKDTITGDNDGTGVMVIQRDPVRRVIENVPRFVHVKGGAYFFLPSITAMRYLAETP